MAKRLNNSAFIGVILLICQKLYLFLPHDLLIVKFEAYGLDRTSLKLLQWNQKYKITSTSCLKPQFTKSFLTQKQFSHNLQKGHVLSQQTFQRCFNVVFWLMRLRDVGQRQIKVETTLCTSTLKCATSNNIESTLCISMFT